MTLHDIGIYALWTIFCALISGSLFCAFMAFLVYIGPIKGRKRNAERDIVDSRIHVHANIAHHSDSGCVCADIDTEG